VLVEISTDEEIVLPIQQRPVIHEYGEKLDASIKAYSLEESIAEKLRAILQHAEMLKQRGWSRSRARDFYDLWRIFQLYEARLQLDEFHLLLSRKCTIRQVTFNGSDDFFPPTMMSYAERTWKNWLGPLVTDLPPFELAVRELRPRIAALL